MSVQQNLKPRRSLPRVGSPIPGRRLAGGGSARFVNEGASPRPQALQLPPQQALGL